MNKFKVTKDIYGNLYYSNDLDGKYCLIVCTLTDVDCTNEFLMDNPDCSVIAEIGGLIFIAFDDDLGKREII